MSEDNSPTITRAYLANKVHQKLGYSRSEASEVVDATFDTITDEICTKGMIKLSSFGTFQVRQKAPRIGRNPKSKKEVPITARKSVSFYVSNLLKKKINNA